MKRETLVLLGLIAITLAAFHGVGQCDFVNFDDPEYIVRNPHVTGGLSVENSKWAWTTFHQGNYIPLTWLSLMLDAWLFGPGPHGFHWINLGFHTANAILVYLFFRRATGANWRSALVAAVFAVHPLRVESVAWVVERKDVLSAFFGLLAMLAYLRYARTLQWKWYAAVVLLFAASLLAKQTLSTLPCLLLLLDFWPLRRWARLPIGTSAGAISFPNPPLRSLPQVIAEKLPLLLIAATILFITFKAQTSFHSVDSSIPLGVRLANVPISYVRYLGKMVWFANLAVFYPFHYPNHQWTPIQVSMAGLLLLSITTLCLSTLRSKPWLSIGWFWFLGVLFPMSGFMQFGPQSMADRFTYISAIGLLVMLVWSIPEIPRGRWGLAAVAAAIPVIVLMVFTNAQIQYWHDGVTLFSHDIDVAGSSPIAEMDLGTALITHGNPRLAIEHLEKSVRMRPHNDKGQGNLALALAKTSQIQQAVPYCETAVQINPKYTAWHLLLAYLRIQTRRFDEAAAECRTAIALDPSSAAAHNSLGLSLEKMGKPDEAIEEYKLALSIQPNMPDAIANLHRIEVARMKEVIKNQLNAPVGVEHDRKSETKPVE